MQFVKERRTEFRKFIKGSELIKTPKSGTSALHKHHNLCKDKAHPIDIDQFIIRFSKSPGRSSSLKKGLTEPALSSPISVVLLKWIDSNNVVNSLFHNNGTFYDFILEKVIPQKDTVQVPSSDHGYVAGASSMSSAE